MEAPRIIAVANHKGGTAKTTTAVNLADSLGSPTLLIDLDPQGNASMWLGADSGSPKDNLFANEASLASQAQPSSAQNVALIPSSPMLATVDETFVGQAGRELLLKRKMMDENLDGWRYILIDTPPARGLITLNALAAADEVLVPVEAHIMALAGVVQILNTIQYVRDHFNPKLKLVGFVICRFDTRNRHCSDVREQMVSRFQKLVLNAVIRENVRLAEAPSFCLPISVYAPKSNGAADFRALAAEIATSR